MGQLTLAQPSASTGSRRTVAVTFVSPHALQGGAERYLETLFAELDPAWVRSVVSLQRGPANDRFREAGHDPVVVHTTGSPLSMLASTWRLRQLLRRDRPDVVHANGIKAALMCVFATRRIPVIWLKHDYSWDGPLVLMVARLSAKVIAVSEAVTEALPRRDKVSVVSPGLAVSPVDRGAGREMLQGLVDAPADAPILALVGRLEPAKGHPEVLAVLPELLERVPELRVAFIGGDNPNHPGYGTGISQQVQALGLGHRVTFLGYRPDARLLIAGCDILVVPSTCDDRGRGRESLSLVAVEAMAAGTPVVAYGHGGLPEVLGDSGVLVPPHDREALGEAIVQVLSDVALRRRLTAGAQARVAERFCAKRNTETLQAHYLGAVRPRRR